MYTVSVIGTPECGKTSFLAGNDAQDGVVCFRNTYFEVKEDVIQSYPDGCSDGIIVLFDCTSIVSFVESIDTVKGCREANPDTPIVWTATKVDKGKERRILWRAVRKILATKLANKNIIY